MASEYTCLFCVASVTIILIQATEADAASVRVLSEAHIEAELSRQKRLDLSQTTDTSQDDEAQESILSRQKRLDLSQTTDTSQDDEAQESILSRQKRLDLSQTTDTSQADEAQETMLFRQKRFNMFQFSETMHENKDNAEGDVSQQEQNNEFNYKLESVEEDFRKTKTATTEELTDSEHDLLKHAKPYLQDPQLMDRRHVKHLHGAKIEAADVRENDEIDKTTFPEQTVSSANGEYPIQRKNSHSNTNEDELSRQKRLDVIDTGEITDRSKHASNLLRYESKQRSPFIDNGDGMEELREDKFLHDEIMMMEMTEQYKLDVLDSILWPAAEIIDSDDDTEDYYVMEFHPDTDTTEQLIETSNEKVPGNDTFSEIIHLLPSKIINENKEDNSSRNDRGLDVETSLNESTSELKALHDPKEQQTQHGKPDYTSSTDISLGQTETEMTNGVLSRQKRAYLNDPKEQETDEIAVDQEISRLKEDEPVGQQEQFPSRQKLTDIPDLTESETKADSEQDKTTPQLWRQSRSLQEMNHFRPGQESLFPGEHIFRNTRDLLSMETKQTQDSPSSNDNEFAEKRTRSTDFDTHALQQSPEDNQLNKIESARKRAVERWHRKRGNTAAIEEEDGWAEELMMREQMAEMNIEYGIRKRRERLQQAEANEDFSVLQKIKQDAEEILQREQNINDIKEGRELNRLQREDFAAGSTHVGSASRQKRSKEMEKKDTSDNGERVEEREQVAKLSDILDSLKSKDDAGNEKHKRPNKKKRKEREDKYLKRNKREAFYKSIGLPILKVPER